MKVDRTDRSVVSRHVLEWTVPSGHRPSHVVANLCCVHSHIHANTHSDVYRALDTWQVPFYLLGNPHTRRDQGSAGCLRRGTQAVGGDRMEWGLP